ncbi:MAG: hypothetical protein IPP37_14360 [Saprospiraceae bacterium]|nr:hypothetical protein [Saprospiraceae bacterium]
MVPGEKYEGYLFEDKEKFVVDKIKAKYMDFYGGTSQLILTPYSYEILGQNLKKYGEFLSVKL